MADGTFQHGTDTIDTDELANRNGSPVTGLKVQRVKAGYGIDGDLWDVTELKGLPVGAASPAVITQTISSVAPTAAIDTAGYQWAAVQVGTGYSGETGLTAQCSVDGVTWFTWTLMNATSTQSATTGSVGVVANLFHGAIPGRYIRFNPAGTYGSGSQIVQVLLTSLPGVLNSLGVSASIGAISSNIAPPLAVVSFSIGTAAGNGFQARATGSADQAAASLVAAVSGQFAYVTGIYVSVNGASATPRLVRVVAGANVLIEQNIVCPANDSRDRVFRNPWKPMSTSNNPINLAVTSIGAAAGTWDVVVEGYFATS